MDDQSTKDDKAWPKAHCTICGTLFQQRTVRSVTCGSAKCLISQQQQRRGIIPSELFHCSVCGTLFQPTYSRHVTCGSLKCQAKRNVQRAAEQQKSRRPAIPSQIKCSVCGEPFKPPNSKSVTCSKDECQRRRRRETKRWNRLRTAMECEFCKRLFYPTDQTPMCWRLECRSKRALIEQEMQRLAEAREKGKQLAGLNEALIPGRLATTAAHQAQAPAGSHAPRQNPWQRLRRNRIPFKTTQPIPGFPHQTPSLDSYPNRPAQVIDHPFRQSNRPQPTAASYGTMLQGPTFPQPVLMPRSYFPEQIPVGDQQGQQDFQREYSEVLSGSFSPDDPVFTPISDTGQDLMVDADQQSTTVAGSSPSGEVSGHQDIPLDAWERFAQEFMALDPMDDPIFREAMETVGQQSTNPDALDDPTLQDTVERTGQRSLNLD
ncbi:hypothetical protein F4680DRAFT_398150 [Xylaria scruposa]|nr:hypothetical protein F4680DRAFT_398150 [Xylaria scruposa]